MTDSSSINTNSANILIVEDEAGLVTLLKYNLESKGMKQSLRWMARK